MTWRGWSGRAPNGMKTVALVSHDRGQTWPEYLDIMDGTADGVIHFEQSVVELPDRRLLAVAWAYEEATGKSRPNPYAICADGQVFSEIKSTGLRGETAKIHALPDGRILCLYRRTDAPGLWGNLSHLDGSVWVNDEQMPLWQGSSSIMNAEATTSQALADLKFGFPSMTLLPDGDILAVFWCQEADVYNIRWLRIGVS